MGVAAIFAIFAGTLLLVPEDVRPHAERTLGKIHFCLTFIGVYAIFVPLHFAGFVGNPRRYPDFKEYEFLKSVLPLHIGVTHAAYFLAAAQLIFLFNYFWSKRRGAVAPANPWGAATREWQHD